MGLARAAGLGANPTSHSPDWQGSVGCTPAGAGTATYSSQRRRHFAGRQIPFETFPSWGNPGGLLLFCLFSPLKWRLSYQLLSTLQSRCKVPIRRETPLCPKPRPPVLTRSLAARGRSAALGLAPALPGLCGRPHRVLAVLPPCKKKTKLGKLLLQSEK